MKVGIIVKITAIVNESVGDDPESCLDLPHLPISWIKSRVLVGNPTWMTEKTFEQSSPAPMQLDVARRTLG